MVRPGRTSAWLLLTTTVAAGGGLVASDRFPVSSQAGYLADWTDLSTWTRENPNTRQEETGLGLVLQGPSGATRLAFFVNQPPRASRPPDSVGFRIGVGARVNPGLLLTPTFRLTAIVPSGAGAPRRADTDLSSRMTVDSPIPGPPITSAVGAMPASTFHTLASATEISGDVLGVHVEFRSDQVAAIRAFRDRVWRERR